jgi:hypothetical protein
MGTQLTGAAIFGIVVLSYVLILQAMVAAVVILGEFIVVRVRALWSLVGPGWKPPASAPMDEDQGEPYRVGGGLMRW